MSVSVGHVMVASFVDGVVCVVLCDLYLFFFLMIRRPPRSTLSSSSAASDVYKRQTQIGAKMQAEQLRILLSVLVILVCLTLAMDFLI